MDDKKKTDNENSKDKKLEFRLTWLTALGVIALLAPGLVVWNKYITVPENALKIIDGAVKANASAIKFQTYRPESMTLNTKNSGFVIKEKTSLWKNKSLFNLFKTGQTPFKWNKILFNYAKKKKILAFSSVFDEEGVDLLESLNNPIYKISSFEKSFLV